MTEGKCEAGPGASEGAGLRVSDGWPANSFASGFRVENGEAILRARCAPAPEQSTVQGKLEQAARREGSPA